MVAVDLSGAACAARRRAVSHAMGLKAMRRSPAFPPVLTSYKLLEIKRHTFIRRTVKFADAAAGGEPMLQHATDSEAAHAYRKLAQELQAYGAKTASNPRTRRGRVL